MVLNDETNEIEENVDRNTTETYNHNNGNSNSYSRYLKLINFFINYKLGYSEQLIKTVIIIQRVFNEIKIGNILKCGQK